MNLTITSFEKYNLKNINDKNKEITQKKEQNINENQVNTNNNDNLTNTNINNNVEKIEYNPLDQKNLFSFNNFYRQRKKIIGGQNFNKIIPEVGVIISNDYKKKQKKFGGFSYMSKYNKPSLNELTKILENNEIIKSPDNSILSFNSETFDINNNNYNGYNEEFSENNNPLFQNALSLDNKNRIFSSFSNKNKKNKFNNYSINIDDSLNKNIRYLKSSFIKASPIKKIIGNSIDNIILSHNTKINDIYRILIDDDKNKFRENEITNKNLIDNTNKNKNIFSLKELIDNKRKLPIINDLKNRNENLKKGRKIIGKFNLDIIQNKNWGNYYNLKKNEKEKNINIISNKLNIEDKYKKLKIVEDNNNKYFIRERNNNIKRKFIRSSSTGALFS